MKYCINPLVGVLVLPDPKVQDSPQDYLRVHNQARATVGVDPIQWDEGVAAFARSYADQLGDDCRLIHSGGPYGENLAGGSGDMSDVSAVNLWVDEKANYNYESNTCNGVCRHYTQVVWRKSVKLGCSKVRCNNGGTIITCNYDPPGNSVYERPY